MSSDPPADPIPMFHPSHVGEARERLNTQLRCMADEIRAWGTVVDAQVDPAIDALIAAVRADECEIAQQKDAVIGGYEKDLAAAEAQLAALRHPPPAPCENCGHDDAHDALTGGGDGEDAVRDGCTHPGCICGWYSPSQGATWLPIATAPKDGTEIVALVSGEPYFVRWTTHGTRHAEPWWRDREGYGLTEPTYWIPLPALSVPPAPSPARAQVEVARIAHLEEISDCLDRAFAQRGKGSGRIVETLDALLLTAAVAQQEKMIAQLRTDHAHPPDTPVQRP